MKNEEYNPLVSVIIPCRNEEKFIGKCLDSIVKIDYPDELLEVLVCDGKSTDGTKEIIKRFSAQYSFIKYLENKKNFTPNALNVGIKNSNGDIVIILGSHSEISPNYIKVCLKIFSEKKELGCAGGLLENVYENERSKNISAAMSSTFGVGSAHFRTGNKEGYVDTVAFGAYKREVFDKIGLFDEELIRNQDDEFNYRVIKAGYKIWLTHEASIKYYVRSSFKNLFKQYFQYGYWKVIVNKKHKTITTFRQIVPALFVLFVFFGAILSFFSNLIFMIYSGITGIYFLSAIFASLGKKKNVTDIIETFFSFMILHFSYGAGYIRGIIYILVLRKNGK